MAGTKTLIFPIETLLAFLTHYTDGDIPLDTKPLAIATHAALNRYVGVWVESTQWRDDPNPDGSYDPAQIRFMGGKVAKWGKTGEELKWADASDALRKK